MGDLNINPAHLKQNLALIVKNIYRWSAVLFLDKANIFLAERTLNNIQRNGLVSVFLEQIKYF